MIEKAAAQVINELIDRVYQRHEEAGAIVAAAQLLAKRGKADRAIKVLMDFEGPTHDALELFKAALSIERELLSATD